MRSPLRIPDAELRQVITEAVEQYMREVKRIRLRAAIIHVHQEEGVPVPEGEAMEAHIDVLESLVDAGQGNLDTILQLIDEMDDPPTSRPISARANHGRKRKGNKWSKHRPNQ